MTGTRRGTPSLWDRILPCIRTIHNAQQDILDVAFEAEYAAGYRGDRKLAAREIGRADAEAEKGD